MSLVTDSRVNSSSSDDFAALLDAELDSNSSDTSPQLEAENDSDSDSNSKIESIKKHKVEELLSIEKFQGSTSHGLLEQNSEASTKMVICTHPGVFRGLCIRCGQKIEDASGVAFEYIHKDLRLGKDEIVRLRNVDLKNLLHHRKLYLVLDLDHTLLNSTWLSDITSEEEYLRSCTDSLQDVSKGSLFMLESMPMLTKLRPFVRTFLKEASKLFEMYIYTMGERSYALEMANLLDPGKAYFSSRVISQADSTQQHQKGLDVVLGQESAVLILDDTEMVWQKHKDNLILMERYHFFASSCHQFGFNCKSLSELKSDESEAEGALATILKVLQQIHNVFFDLELSNTFYGRDVRQVLKSIRKEVLKGCKIVFSRVFPAKFQDDNHHLWKMAEQLGAQCLTELDPSVTHVVTTDARTEKSLWAVQERKFLVHPQWIEAANYFWRKLPEERFSINEVKQ